MPSDNNNPRDSNLSPAEKQVKGFSQQIALATELPFVLVASTGVGGGLGYLLDHWLHTKSVFMIILGLLGFFGGLREVLRRLK
jgi:F0F1-type ATP synthase assembly protein I